MNGQTTQFAQRDLVNIDWSPRWPPLSDWCKAAAIGALIGFGLGINSQVWPWHMMTLAPRVGFWLIISLLTTLQWVVVTSLLPIVGNPGWLQRVARPVVVLLVLAPFMGIEYAVATRVAGILPGVSFADMPMVFAWHFLRWGLVLALPLVLVISSRDKIGTTPQKPNEMRHPVPNAVMPSTPSNDAADNLLWSPIAAIIALKAEDHYVRVFTDHGDSLVLMRFADAISRVAQTNGIQVHRSYWVRESAIEALTRKGRRYELRLSNGLVVPVSRASERDVKSRARADAG